MKSFTKSEVANLEKRFRTAFVNSISGFKSANLIGSIDAEGRENLAIFSSVIHLGSDPALIGFVTRPTSVDRHTYHNIVTKNAFTVNAVHAGLLPNAHLTAARFDKDVSEFEACGITAEYLHGFAAPFVRDSPLKLACILKENIPIVSNGTRLIVAEVEAFHVKDDLIAEDGFIDLSLAGIAAISSLDAYHIPEAPARYAYAKPHIPAKRIN